MMRVAMIGPFGLRPKGTVAARALPLAKALARRGHEIWVLVPPWSNAQDSGREWTEDDVRINNVKIAPRLLIPLRLLTSTRRTRPDVVHVFKPKGYSGVTQWLLWQLRRSGVHSSRIILDEDDWEGA